MLEKYEDKYKIKYFDIDKDNYATPSSIIEYMQEASSSHGEVVGCTMKFMQEKSFAWILIEKCVNIYKLPKLGDDIIIKTWSCGSRSLYAYRKYQVFNKDNELIADSNSKWIMFSTERKRPIKLSEEIFSMYARLGDVTEEGFVDIKDNKTYDKIIKQTVLYRDVDTNWHMNNTKYIKEAIESMDNIFLDSYVVEKYSVKYIKQLVYSDNYNICIKKISNTEYMYYINQDSQNKNNAEIYIKWKKK